MLEKVFWLIVGILALRWAWYLIVTPSPHWKYMTMSERRWAKKWTLFPLIGRWDMNAPQVDGVEEGEKK